MATAEETIPVTVTQEAREYADRHGLCPALEGILERAKDTIPDLVELQIEFDQYPMTQTLGILIVLRRSNRFRPASDSWDFDPTNLNLWGWLISAFPPDICRHFAVLSERVDDAA